MSIAVIGANGFYRHLPVPRVLTVSANVHAINEHVMPRMRRIDHNWQDR
jgi:hypothetical protein